MSFWLEKRVLVTGATGIVGSQLCKKLIKEGAHVVAFILDRDYQSDFYRSKVYMSCVEIDGKLERIEDCIRALNLHDIEIVFHLGAQTQVSTALREPLDTFESNIRGTYNILESIRRMGTMVKSTVIASSDKAYGDMGGIPYIESMALKANHPYDVSKAISDMLATTYAHTYNTRVAVTRCGNIYGPGDLNWNRIVPGTIRSLVKGEAPQLRSSGNQTRDYVYVEDIVDAYMTTALALFDSDIYVGESYNFSWGVGLSAIDIVRIISDIMGSSLKPVILNTANFEILDQILDSSKAYDQLHWRPQYGLSDGLRRTIDWYLSYFSTKEL